MCKFIRPEVPQEASTDERRALYFDALNSLDMSDKVEKRENLIYLSWANAWAEFKRCYPSATYRIIKNHVTKLPYFADPIVGIMVYTEVTVDNITHEMWLPVMNGANKAMRFESYTYQVWDTYKKQYVEKTVQAASMFDINKTIMRCLVKNLAMFGLGLYIYAGEDLPDKNEPVTGEKEIDKENKTSNNRKSKGGATQQPAQTDRHAGIKTALNACESIEQLSSLYQQHKNEVDGNGEIKALFTERNNQLIPNAF